MTRGKDALNFLRRFAIAASGCCGPLIEFIDTYGQNRNENYHASGSPDMNDSSKRAFVTRRNGGREKKRKGTKKGNGEEERELQLLRTIVLAHLHYPSPHPPRRVSRAFRCGTRSISAHGERETHFVIPSRAKTSKDHRCTCRDALSACESRLSASSSSRTSAEKGRGIFNFRELKTRAITFPSFSAKEEDKSREYINVDIIWTNEPEKRVDDGSENPRRSAIRTAS